MSTPRITTSSQMVETILSWCQGDRPGDSVASWGEREVEEARWAIQVHGVGALLGSRLAGGPQDVALPAGLREYLLAQHRLNGQRIAVMLEELGRILEMAANAEIEVVPLKGSAMAFHHYADPAWRPMADLDLLVRPAQLKEFLERLAELGFKSSGETLRHRSLVLARRGEQVVDYRGEHPENPYCLDVHTHVDERLWGLSYPLTETLWASASPSKYGGQPGLLLRPPALLEHLSIHCSHDMRAGKFRWIQLHDIALLAPLMSSECWSELCRSAASRRGERFLWAPLMMAARDAGAAVPAGVIAELERGTPPALRSFLETADAWRLSYCNPRAQGLAEKLCWHRPGLERVRGLRAMLLPSPRELSQWYPKAKLGLRTPLLYARYVARAAGWILRQAGNGRRRAWPYE